jgi:hypothetical protein
MLTGGEEVRKLMASFLGPYVFIPSTVSVMTIVISYVPSFIIDYSYNFVL